MNQDAAEIVGLQALAFIMGDEGLALRLLRLTGLTADELRQNAQDPGMLASILDFLLADEKSLLAFAESSDIPPEVPARARRALAPDMDSIS